RRDRSYPADERLDVARHPGAPAQDDVDLDEPQGLKRFGVGRRREYRVMTERGHEPRPQRIVARHDQDRIHAGTGSVAVAAIGKSTVKTAPPASRLVTLRRAPCL